MQNKLSFWKGRILSKGGKLVLKNVLLSLPLYFFSLFSAPLSIINLLEKIQRNFFWRASNDFSNFHLMDWKSMCKPLDKDGLDILLLRFLIQHCLESGYGDLGKRKWSYDERLLWLNMTKIIRGR